MTSVGQGMKRKEGPRMITGRGRDTEDISLSGMAQAAIVRTPAAHAAITAIDTSTAEERAGAAAVRVLDADSIAAAAEHAADGTEPPAHLNATADYKRHLARVLAKRALTAAAEG